MAACCAPISDPNPGVAMVAGGGRRFMGYGAARRKAQSRDGANPQPRPASGSPTTPCPRRILRAPGAKRAHRPSARSRRVRGDGSAGRAAAGTPGAAPRCLARTSRARPRTSVGHCGRLRGRPLDVLGRAQRGVSSSMIGKSARVGVTFAADAASRAAKLPGRI